MDQLVVCGGCNSKIGPGDLGDLLSDLPKNSDKNLLVGFDSSDDAAVYKVSDDLAIIQTLDFFPTMVNDPYTFGKIAAANALSDIYAMGGEVISALNIVAFPEEEDLSLLKGILRGGAEKVKEAGAVLAGGHSIHDHSVKYGLSVIGKVNPAKIYKNDTCQAGDHLILTKPLGVSILATGYSVGEIAETGFNKAVKSMETLNKHAMDIIKKYQVNSCTDVTGFGLLGHLYEMLHGEFSAQIDSSMVPYFEEAYEGAKNFIFTAGGQRNRNYLEKNVAFNIADFPFEEILYDPQTSGGILVAVPENEAGPLLDELIANDIVASDFGRVGEKTEKAITVN